MMPLWKLLFFKKPSVFWYPKWSHVCLPSFSPQVCWLTYTRTYAREDMRKRFCRQFVEISSWLGQNDLLSVVQTETVPLTQQEGGRVCDVFKLLTHNLILLPKHHQPMPSVLHTKRKPRFSGNSPFLSEATHGLLWGENIWVGSANSATSCSRAEVLRCPIKRSENYLKNRILTFSKAH